MENEQLPRLLLPRWLEEFFKMVKKGADAPLENRIGDVAAVLDVATASATYKKKIYSVMTPMSEQLAQRES